MFLHQVTNAGRRELMSEFPQLAGDPDVAPGILTGHPQRQRFSRLGFGRSARIFRGIVEGPFPPFHPSVPGQESFRADDGNNFPQPTLEGHAVTDQSAAVRLSQRHSFAQLTAQNLVFLPEIIILLGRIFAEELLDPGDEGSGGAVNTGFYSVKFS